MVADVALQLLACAFLYGIAEHLVHRYDMHRPGSYRYWSHAVEHHGQGHMGVDQASLTQRNAWYGFLVTLPLTLPTAWLWGWSFLACWALTIFWAGFAWTAVHRHIHGEPGYGYAWLLCPWLPLVRWNHLRHHRNTKVGYGGLFFFLSDPPAWLLARLVRLVRTA